MTAWSMLARLALKTTRVRSRRTSSRVRSDPCVWIVELVFVGPVPGGAAKRVAIPSSASPGMSRFAAAAEPACSTAAPAFVSRL